MCNADDNGTEVSTLQVLVPFFIHLRFALPPPAPQDLILALHRLQQQVHITELILFQYESI